MTNRTPAWMWRVFFCAFPALVIGGVLALLFPPLGVLMALCVFGLGWDVTQIRPERGESHER
jgi:hypothetical protein